MTVAVAPRAGRPALSVARVLYLLVVAGVLAWLVWDRRHDLAGLLRDARIGLLALALAISFGQLWLSAGFWAMALRSLGEPLPFATVLDATARSVLARYIPGSVWYAVGRSALLRRHQVSGRSLGAVAVLETGLSVVVGFVIGAALLLATRRVAPGIGALGLGCVVLAAAACSPPSVNRLLAWYAGRRGGTAPRLGWPQFAGLVAWLAVFWGGAAASFVVFLHAFPAVVAQVGFPSVLLVVGAFMVARVLGMLAVFAPQGLGVFEVAVSALLLGAAPRSGAGLAGLVLVVAGYRALALVRDGLALGAFEARHTARGARAAQPGSP